MAGLINTQLKQDEDILDPKKVRTAGVTGYEPERRVVGQDELVSAQMNKLLSAGDPYFERTKAGAMGTANARGLLNSTMAAQAGEAAAIDAVLPVASADAGTYNLTARENYAAANRAFEFGAGETNQTNRLNAEALNQIGRMQTGAELEKGLIGTRTTAEKSLIGERTTAESRLLAEKGVIEKGLVEARGTIEKAVQELRGAQGEKIANIEANYRQLIQTSDAAGRFYSEMARDIGAIMANKDTSKEQKTAALERMADLLESGLTVIGEIGNVDIASLLDFSPVVSGP